MTYNLKVLDSRIYLKVAHPVQRVLVVDDVDLVHGEDEGELVLVQDGARVQPAGIINLNHVTDICVNDSNYLLSRKSHMYHETITWLLRKP